jgi:hypothetical protein
LLHVHTLLVDDDGDDTRGDWLHTASLPESLHHKGYCIVADNYYTSIPLVLQLIALGYHYVGTLRKNKKGIDDMEFAAGAKVHVY